MTSGRSSSGAESRSTSGPSGWSRSTPSPLRQLARFPRRNYEPKSSSGWQPRTEESYMRIGTIDSRLVLIAGDRYEDVERASDGKFGSDVLATLEQWEAFRVWA